jgi:Helix-turn-helix domain
MSAPPVTDAERARIRELHGQGLNCSQIAAELGRGKATVTRHCQEMGLSFDRAKTEAATSAKVADNAARRAEISRRFLEKSAELLDQMGEPHTAFNFGGKDNTYEEHTFERPPVDALKTLMHAAAQAFDKHLAQDKHDSADDQAAAEAAKSVLTEVLDSLTARHGDGG